MSRQGAVRRVKVTNICACRRPLRGFNWVLYLKLKCKLLMYGRVHRFA